MNCICNAFEKFVDLNTNKSIIDPIYTLFNINWNFKYKKEDFSYKHLNSLGVWQHKHGSQTELMFLTTVLNVFMKLEHCFLLLFCLNGSFSKSSDFFDGVQTWDVPCFHQVAGQHGPRPAMTMHAVNRNGLRSTKNQHQLLSGWQHFMKTLQLLTFNIIVTHWSCACVCVCVYVRACVRACVRTCVERQITDLG